MAGIVLSGLSEPGEVDVKKTSGSGGLDETSFGGLRCKLPDRDSGAPDAPILELESARLVLRQWQDDDLREFAALCADPQVMRYFPAPMTRLEAAALIGRVRGHFNEFGFGLWALERKDSGAFIGMTGLLNVNFEAPFGPAVEIGWRLARRHWGWGSPARRPGPACAVLSPNCAWRRWCRSLPRAICRRRKSCRPSACSRTWTAASNTPPARRPPPAPPCAVPHRPGPMAGHPAWLTGMPLDGAADKPCIICRYNRAVMPCQENLP
jgi:hypothetical protein